MTDSRYDVSQFFLCVWNKPHSLQYVDANLQESYQTFDNLNNYLDSLPVLHQWSIVIPKNPKQ